ncbi:AT-hook motif nuclear-localized protein 16 [Lathyrus oleraceus]|uniref:AT-hook motif nuclear-localized protein 16 n=1 Tax=Pisum sativum TaxID=3888 RepID=UPI0021D01009|nr:AT-hook motif nuclear-localized protein 16-like [Pisum sativum]
MTHKEFASSSFPSKSISSNSNNDFSGNNPSIFSTHSNNLFSTVGGNKKLIVSHTTTTTNNDILMMPSSSSAQPSFDRDMDFPQNPPKNPSKSSSKKRMGRPLGSKNRPKTHIIIEENRETFTEVVTLQISAGEDIVENIIKYAQRRQTNIIVSRDFGLISNITFLDPVSRVPLLPIEGPVHMTSLFGTYINPNCECPPRKFISHPPCSSFTIYFSSPNEYVFGGIVGGKVTAAGVILINATLVRKTTFHREVAHEFDSNYNVFHAPIRFNDMDANSTLHNYQLSPHYLPIDGNVIDENLMRWNHSNHPHNY